MIENEESNLELNVRIIKDELLHRQLLYKADEEELLWLKVRERILEHSPCQMRWYKG